MSIRLGFDLEARTLADMLYAGLWQPREVPLIERQIRERILLVESGLSSPTSSHWTAKLRTYDPLLRLRWDLFHGWVIEREIHLWGCWAICGVIGHRCVPFNLIDILIAGDMQRIGPERYLKEKREAADKIARGNEQRATDKLQDIIGAMSNKRIKEFIEVERAVQTGEKIVAHGATEKMLDTMTRASEQAGQTPEPESFDSDDHPLRHTHKTGGVHVRSGV